MAEKNTQYGFIVFALVLFLVLTSPNWDEVLGVNAQGPVILMAVLVIGLLAWVIKGSD